MNKVKTIFVLLLTITISSFTMGDVNLALIKDIQDAIKAKDVQALELVLKTAEVDDTLRLFWDYNFIREALELCPEAVLPLWEYGIEHGLQSQSISNQKKLLPDNVNLVLNLNDEKISKKAIKYYKLTEEKEYSSFYTKVSIEFLNLMLSNGLETHKYISIVSGKIDRLSLDNKIDELKNWLQKIKVNKNDLAIWDSSLTRIRFFSQGNYYSREVALELMRFLYLKINSSVLDHELKLILKKCDKETASVVIKNNLEKIKDLDCYSNENIPISIDILNLLLENGLQSETYACFIGQNLQKNNDAEYTKTLLEEIPENQLKAVIGCIVTNKLSPEIIKAVIEFAKERGIEAFPDKNRLLEAIQIFDEETASSLIETYPHIIKTLDHNDYNDYQTQFTLRSMSPQILKLFLVKGLNFEIYAAIIANKIGAAIVNKNKEAVQALLDGIEVTETNQDAWIKGFERHVMHYTDNTFPEIVLTLLQFGEQKGLKLLKGQSHYQASIIKNCDEETALFAIAHYPEEVAEAGNMLFYHEQNGFDYETQQGFCTPYPTNQSTKLIIQLFNHKCAKLLYNLPSLDNGLEALKEIMKEDPSLILNHPDLDELLIGAIEDGRFDILETLSQYRLTLENIATTHTNIDIEDLLCAAVDSTNGSKEMFNYVLNALDAHQSSIILACAAQLEDYTFFNTLLQKGYAADSNLESESNLYGLTYAINSGNIQAITYYLEQGVNPNESFGKLGGLSFVLEGEDYGPTVQSERIKILELLIAHGLKITSLDIAACAQYGSLELIQFFKEKGYNTRHSAIFVAACGSNNCNLELLDFLLEDGANINDPNALVAGVRAGSYRGNKIQIVQYLIEKGANPDNLMALNQALTVDEDPTLEIAKYLVEKGAKVEPRCIITAGLSGKSVVLRWTLEQMNTRIPAELEDVLAGSESDITQYTLQNLLPKNSILIGVSNYSFSFTDGILKVIAKLIEKNSNVFIVPLSDKIASDSSIMIRFSGFINPGAVDNYPKKMSTFSLKNMSEEQMFVEERLYQKVISFAKKYDIPYLGICAGSQHLNLNSDGYLQPVKGHAGEITVHFEKGSIPHFMTLLPNEKAKAIRECQLVDISFENSIVLHNYAGMKDKLGRNVKLGAISGKDASIPESIYHGRNQIGVQFHPERAYFREEEGKTNRHKVLLDSFFENSLDYQKSRTYALEYGFHYSEVKDNIYQANEKLIKHLESCAKDPNYSSNDHFWGKDLGSYELSAEKSKNGAVNILTGLTPKDIGLARDGDDLILIIKSSGEMLSIESHFAEDGEHRVKSIDFADGSRLILNHDAIHQDGRSVNLDSQINFYRNATGIAR